MGLPIQKPKRKLYKLPSYMKNSPALSGEDRVGEFFNILEVIIHKILTVEESRGIIILNKPQK